MSGVIIFEKRRYVAKIADKKELRGIIRSDWSGSERSEGKWRKKLQIGAEKEYRIREEWRERIAVTRENR